jgi:GT2 family glycosyltransferase
MPHAEIIVASRRALDDCRPLAESWRARVVALAQRSGPAAARNRGARAATGQILVFVDSDVVVAPDAIAGMCALLERDPAISATFGAYDRLPPERGFMSQYRNLSHAYIHETGNQNATTFWAGLGAMRATVFQSAGGFDERFTRPSIEDIELGYRHSAERASESGCPPQTCRSSPEEESSLHRPRPPLQSHFAETSVLRALRDSLAALRGG